MFSSCKQLFPLSPLFSKLLQEPKVRSLLCTRLINFRRTFKSCAIHKCSKDFYLPNSKWPEEAKEIFHELNKLTEDGSWIKYVAHAIDQEDGPRAYVRASGHNMFTGALFYNKNDRICKGVITFQEWTQGGPGHVHGGAAATIFDSFMGILSNYCIGPCVTANLNVNYKRPLPLLTTVRMDAKVDHVEKKKVYLSSSMKSIDAKIEYSTATSLFILMGKPSQ